MNGTILEFSYPLSLRTHAYIEITGELPNRMQLRALMRLLDANIALLEEESSQTTAVSPSVTALTQRNGFKRFIDPETSDQIVKLFQSHVSISEIARKLKFSAQGISNHLVKLGLTNKRPRLIKNQKESA